MSYHKLHFEIIPPVFTAILNLAGTAQVDPKLVAEQFLQTMFSELGKVSFEESAIKSGKAHQRWAKLKQKDKSKALSGTQTVKQNVFVKDDEDETKRAKLNQLVVDMYNYCADSVKFNDNWSVWPECPKEQLNFLGTQALRAKVNAERAAKVEADKAKLETEVEETK